jgi:hypothetical protein
MVSKEALKYYKEYRKMKELAISRMKKYGKVLEVMEMSKESIMDNCGYKTTSEITQEDFDEWKISNTYDCVVRSRHEELLECTILMVRYNEKKKDVDVYVESDNGEIAEWMPASYIDYERDAAYLTILDFIQE